MNVPLLVHHSETIVEIFRFCIRKDTSLSVALTSSFKGFDLTEDVRVSVALAGILKNYGTPEQ